ncbi:MAG: hypothetical protein AAB373_06825 [Patescibacteria group bacterium]
MFNSNLKKVVLASAIAVFAGVSMLGVNAVMGATTATTTTTTTGLTAPTQNPDSAKLVSPTFDSLNIQGDLKNNLSGQALKITDPDGVQITAPLSLQSIKNTLSFVAPVKIDDNLDVIGNISNSTANTAVLINDDVLLQGTLDLTGKIVNSIGNLIVGGKNIQFGETDGTSAITVKGASITMTGATSFSNDIDAKAKIKNTTAGKSVEVSDDLLVTGKIDALADVNVQNLNASNMHSTGHLWMNNNAVMLSNDSWIHQLTNGPLTIKAHSGRELELLSGDTKTSVKLKANGNTDILGNLNISGALASTTTSLLVQDNVSVAGNVGATGTVTAKRFGTYSTVNSSMMPMAQDVSAEATIACPVNTYIVGCDARSSDTTSFSSWTKWVYINHSYTDVATNTCKVRGVNTATSTRYVGATAVCLNPNI